MGGAGETADDEVAAWLRSVHLERYTQALAELGYERLNFFRGIDADELSELMETVQMARPHRRVFSDALAQIDGRTGASAPGGSAAAAATLSPHQQQAPQAAVLAQQPSGIRTVAGAGPLSPSAPPLEAALLPVSGGFSTTTQSSSGSGRARAPPLSLQQGRRPKQPLCDRRRMGRCLCALGLAAVVLTGVLLAKRCMDTPGSRCRPGPACRHGNSTDHISCLCESGWEGSLCEERVPCFGVKCGEHGHCSWTPASRRGHCVCQNLWNGTQCEVFIPCIGVQCGSHGRCDDDSIVGEGKGKCICDLGWLGDRCETDECSGVKCGPRGKCAPVEPQCGTVSTGCGPQGNDPCDCPSECDPKTCKSRTDPSEDCAKKYDCQYSHGACRCEQGWTGPTCETQCCSTFCPWLEGHMENRSLQCGGNCCAGQCCRRRSLVDTEDTTMGLDQQAEDTAAAVAYLDDAVPDDRMLWSVQANALVPAFAVADGHGCCGGPPGSGQPTWCCSHCSSAC